MTLEIMLSPRLLQMLKVLSLPYIELVNKINQEAEENPVLEVERQDEYVEFVRYLTSDKKIKKEADFEALPGLENISSSEKSLESHLIEQLNLEDLDEPQHSIALMIIENIDDFGYLINYPRLREEIMAKFNLSRPTVDNVLKIVQAFEPEGVGARDLKECLLIQAREYNFENETLQKLIEQAIAKHLDALAQEKFALVADELGISENGARELAVFIKNNLNPHPGAAFGGETRHIIPSFAIELTDNGYRLVNLETRYGPVLNLSAQYLKMLDDPKTDAQTKAFLAEKLKRAKSLIEDFSKRSETLEKIVRKITEEQKDFLNKGATWLHPLSQKSLADEFGLHPSTISRTVSAKYLQTPQGVFQLKSLCPRGPKGLTVNRLKAMLAEIIKQEDKNEPLSDSEVTQRLKEQGAKIDRRTVAYYRKELNLPTADERHTIK